MGWHRLGRPLLTRATQALTARQLAPGAARLRVCAAADSPTARALLRQAPRLPAAAGRSISASAAASREHPECGYPGTMEGITYL